MSRKINARPCDACDKWSDLRCDLFRHRLTRVFLVCIFTTLLFLSGYVLQQQTIHSLQEAIHPKLAASPVQTLNPKLAKHFGRPPGHSFYDKYLTSNRPKGGWAKVAYVQLLRSHMHVCNSVMIFATFESQESMAQRILMYPKEWDDMDESDKEVATSKRLLREAASRYKVMLQPIRPMAYTIPKESELPQGFSDEERYPLSNLVSLINFNRIIYFQPSGMVFDASPLDLLFTLPMESNNLLGLTSPITSSADRPAILLIEPSKKLYQETMAALPEGTFQDLEFLQLLHITHAPSTASDPDQRNPAMLLAESSSLHSVDAGFNATKFLDTTGYVHFQDEGVPGPEYDHMQGDFEKAAPSRREARNAWTGVYEKFREGRIDFCGLDLEPIVSKEEEMVPSDEVELPESRMVDDNPEEEFETDQQYDSDNVATQLELTGDSPEFEYKKDDLR
ncbi:uncharacterized protein KY384_000547 [Bacidia gigantensis]|uniref:uncharacterized protein n=1 Tax=Bacidia gigantensis TaxID=2732470 RepID=UPI001D05A19A|nr:uncharacterized protein KY384_000547 [Bacidia gigantensis]KAG8525787.1 hypothetical protein KY384_000547 [Bacidia gigantensis]